MKYIKCDRPGCTKQANPGVTGLCPWGFYYFCLEHDNKLKEGASMSHKVLLDMDGVLADFIPGICAHHGKPNPYEDPSNRGIWDTNEIWGMSLADFWQGVDYKFWAGLAQTPEAKNIVELAEELVGPDNIRLLTCPPDNPSAAGECVRGKQIWLHYNFPRYRNSVIYTKHKEWCANSNTILVDDNKKNCDLFFAAGGMTIRVPRPWNDLHALNTMQHVENSFNVYKAICEFAFRDK